MWVSRTSRRRPGARLTARRRSCACSAQGAAPGPSHPPAGRRPAPYGPDSASWASRRTTRRGRERAQHRVTGRPEHDTHGEVPGPGTDHDQAGGHGGLQQMSRSGQVDDPDLDRDRRVPGAPRGEFVGDRLERDIPLAQVRFVPDQVVTEQARAVHGVHDHQPGAVPLRVGEGHGDRDGVGVDVLDTEHHRPVIGHDPGDAADDGHGTPGRRAHGQRRRVQADVLVPLASAHGDHQELGVLGVLGQCRGRVPGDAGGRHLHVVPGLLRRRRGQGDDRLGAPRARHPAPRVGRHVDDPQRRSAAVCLFRRPAHGGQGDAGPVNSHDHRGRCRASSVHLRLLFIERSGFLGGSGARPPAAQRPPGSPGRAQRGPSAALFQGRKSASFGRR